MSRCGRPLGFDLEGGGGWSDLVEDGFAVRAEVLDGLDHAGGDAFLGFFEVGAGVVGFFVADFAVDFEDAVVVFHDVVDDGAGEGVLGIGVDVHFDDAVVEGFADFFDGGAGAAVEDEVELGVGAVFGDDGVLAFFEDVGAEFDGAGFVGSVDVAEGGGEHVAADATEGFVNGEHVLRGGVEFFVGEAGVVVAVFLAADDAGLDFEDDFVAGALGEEFFGEFHILGQGEFGGVEHVGVEEVVEAGGAAAGGFGDEGFEEFIDFFGLAVVGVEADEDVVFFGEAVGGLGEDDGAEGHVFDGGAGGEFAAAGGDLDDAIGFGFGEGFEGGADGAEGSDVDGGVGVAAFLGGVEHGGKLAGGGDGHDGKLVGAPGKESGKRRG